MLRWMPGHGTFENGVPTACPTSSNSSIGKAGLHRVPSNRRNTRQTSNRQLFVSWSKPRDFVHPTISVARLRSGTKEQSWAFPSSIGLKRRVPFPFISEDRAPSRISFNNWTIFHGACSIRKHESNASGSYTSWILIPMFGRDE